MPTSAKTALDTSAEVRDDRLFVRLDDGRELSVPLSWFPRLEGAAEEPRRNWELIGPGLGLHWPELDEHISVASLLRPEDHIPSRKPRQDGE